VTDFISNPRRALRLPLRCAARVESYGADCEGHTEDLGARGCRLAVAAPLTDGGHVRLHLLGEGSSAPLQVGAVVKWTEPGPPWRHGLDFDAEDRPRAEAWFDELASCHSELLHLVRVPDQLRLDARLYVTHAPAVPLLLGDEETVVLRFACGQPTLAQLQRVLGPDWSRAQRALFALIGRGAVTLDEAEAGDPAPWRAQLEADRHGGRFRS